MAGDPGTGNPAIGKDVEANGIRTNYLEAGSATGTSSWSTAWAGVTRTRTGEVSCPSSARTSTWSPPTWSGSATGAPDDVTYRLDTWSDQAIAVMDALGIEKAHLSATASAARSRCA